MENEELVDLIQRGINPREGLIRFENMGENEYFIYDDKNKILRGEKTGKTYNIGQKINVEVIETISYEEYCVFTTPYP